LASKLFIFCTLESASKSAMSFIIPHGGDMGWVFLHLESNVANGDDKDWFGYSIELGDV
jgi:hypothetical protein